MNIRLRFSLLFSLLVSVILLCTVSVIYFLYANNRKDDFNKRLWAQSLQAYQDYTKLAYPNQQKVIESKQFYFPGNLINGEVVIYNKNNSLVYRTPDTASIWPNAKLLSTIRTMGAYYFSHKQKEVACFYFNVPGNEYVVISSATDVYGKRRVNNLSVIMTLVTMGGIILSGFFAFFYVKQITKPLNKLGLQMQRISENNLKERVPLIKGINTSSDLSKIAQQFNEMLDRLENAFELQKSFVHHASHELRTPLASMLSQTESALRKELNPIQAKNVLASLKEDQQEMIELTNSLLLLSQYEQVKYSNDWPLLRLDEILYETIDNIKCMLPQVNITLEFLRVPDNELNLSTWGNDALLRSAFTNLIKNAFQYSEDKVVAISIDPQNNCTYIHFENNGSTVTSSDEERLFIPFFRGENAQQKKGFGLGLSIVKRIIVLHKGAISYSSLNGMNRFTVRFEK